MSNYAFEWIGICVAVFISWQHNHSILWAIIHAFFGWFYIIYSFFAH